MAKKHPKYEPPKSPAIRRCHIWGTHKIFFPNRAPSSLLCMHKNAIGCPVCNSCTLFSSSSPPFFLPTRQIYEHHTITMAVIASDHLTMVGWHGHGLSHMPCPPWTGCYTFTLPVLSIDNNNNGNKIFIVICYDLCCKPRRWTMSTSYFHINYVPRKKKNFSMRHYHRLRQSTIQ